VEAHAGLLAVTDHVDAALALLVDDRGNSRDRLSAKLVAIDFVTGFVT
jgi:hypothetical protein